uniref:Histone-like transcription factor (CBF/NF-Y) and archaeal histone domain containing protein n=1 Tax=Babesia bovis TaxID=5865 RepID=S6AZT8_BABBO|nr:histone-like transcription factor (CBF/NF-Y) and archaeal histone domain containing protein [Babesia bovis]
MSGSSDADLLEDGVDWQAKHNDNQGSDRSSAAGEGRPSGKSNNLPIARIKKIMKEGEHPGMIAADAPVLLAKACEMLIKDLTLQSWDCTVTTSRCTLQRQDVAAAIFKNDIYNFMLDIFTPDELIPKMEPKIGNSMQFNNMKLAKDPRGFAALHGAANSRNGYLRKGMAVAQIPRLMGPKDIYNPGVQRPLMSRAPQGRAMGSYSTFTMASRGVNGLNNMLQFSNRMGLGNSPQTTFTPNTPIQPRPKSQTMAPGYMHIPGINKQMSHNQHQSSYVQPYATGQNLESPRTHQPQQ